MTTLCKGITTKFVFTIIRSPATSRANALNKKFLSSFQRSLRPSTFVLPKPISKTIGSLAFSTTTSQKGNKHELPSDIASVTKIATIQVGEKDKKKERNTYQYVLLPISFPPERMDPDNPGDRDLMSRETIAYLYSSRNIIFGASKSSSVKGEFAACNLADLCGPLVDAAKIRCDESGEQVQAMATLHGLCDWVQNLMDTTDQDAIASQSMDKILKLKDGRVTYDAIKAVATGIPREGHSVVGQGTYRDAREGWTWLAKEFADELCADGLDVDNNEVVLYKSKGAVTVAVEYLADTSEGYLRSAGGSMVRMYFV